MSQLLSKDFLLSAIAEAVPSRPDRSFPGTGVAKVQAPVIGNSAKRRREKFDGGTGTPFLDRLQRRRVFLQRGPFVSVSKVSIAPLRQRLAILPHGDRVAIGRVAAAPPQLANASPDGRTVITRIVRGRITFMPRADAGR